MQKLFGYEVEKVNPNEYKLYGPKATYTLRRNGQYLTPFNSRGNCCSIKGNYTFSDKTGTLEAINW